MNIKSLDHKKLTYLFAVENERDGNVFLNVSRDNCGTIHYFIRDCIEL